MTFSFHRLLAPILLAPATLLAMLGEPDPAAATASFEPPVKLSGVDPLTTPALAPDVAAEGSNVYVVWYERGIGSSVSRVVFRRSSDGGETYGAGITLSETGSLATAPRLAATGSDVYVVWEQAIGAGKPAVYVRASRDQGVNWDPPLNLSLTPGTIAARHPAIASTGPQVYVVWDEERPGGGTVGPGSVIRFRRSRDQGTTFEPAIDVGVTEESHNVNPAIAATGSAVYIAWHTEPDAPKRPDIFFRRSLDEGASWSSPAVTISADEGASRNPSVAALGAAVLVTWEDDTEHPGVPEIYFKDSQDQGATFFFPPVVANQGNFTSPATVTNFYLSSSSTLGPGAELLRTVTIPPLEPEGGSQTIALRALLLSGTASGKFVIAVVDATNVALETDEGNNVIVGGPLPLVGGP